MSLRRHPSKKIEIKTKAQAEQLVLDKLRQAGEFDTTIDSDKTTQDDSHFSVIQKNPKWGRQVRVARVSSTGEIVMGRLQDWPP